MSSNAVVISTLKRLLKAQKINYKTLGFEMGMSESGVKKLLTAKDISLSRLNQISEILGTPLAEILKTAEEEEIKHVQLSSRQIQALQKDQTLFRVFWSISVEENSRAEIQKREGLTAAKLESLLRKLENLDLIKVGKNNRVMAMTKGLYRWVGENPLLAKLNADWSYSTLKKSLGHKDSGHLHRLAFLKLREESRLQFYQRLGDLADEFSRLSQREKMQFPNEKLQPLCLLFALSNTSFLD